MARRHPGAPTLAPQARRAIAWVLLAGLLVATGACSSNSSSSEASTTTIAATGSGNSLQAVVSAGASGVLVRTAPGGWDLRPVRSARAPTRGALPSSALLCGYAATAALCFGLLTWGRRRWPSVSNGLIVALVGTVIGFCAFGVLLMWVDADQRTIGVPGPVAAFAAATWIATIAATTYTARRPAKQAPTPLWQLPLPPPH